MAIQENENPRTCIYCGKRIYGRSEKKFCNVDCKNNYNSRLKAETKAKGVSDQRETINTIKNNYQILLGYKAKENELTVNHVTEKELLEKGFNPDFLTSYIESGSGLWKCCFDICYLQQPNGDFMLRCKPPIQQYIDEDTQEVIYGQPRFD